MLERSFYYNFWTHVAGAGPGDQHGQLPVTAEQPRTPLVAGEVLGLPRLRLSLSLWLAGASECPALGPCAVLGFPCPMRPVPLSGLESVFIAQIPDPSRLYTVYFPIRPSSVFISFLGLALPWGHCRWWGSLRWRLGEGRGASRACHSWLGMRAGYLHLGSPAGDHSFLWHTFIPHSLCARRCSRTWGLSCVHSEDPHFPSGFIQQWRQKTRELSKQENRN